MNKIVLSACTALTLGTVAINADTLKLYQDANGQLYTQAGENRTLVKTIKDSTPVFSHADKLKFNGQAFIGYKATKYDSYQGSTPESDQAFQIRRGYFQLKAYLLDDPKSYYRVTFDVKNNPNFDTNSLDVRAKYAYVNLNEVLPSTSLEIGLAHRPWHDYEEHNSWLYRSVSEVFIENKNSAHISSSADYGVMAKTRTKYFDSDIGIFNGEGYHGTQNSNGVSLEWRFTGHLLGTHGHPEKTTYLDASFFGQLNQKHYASTAQGTVEDDDLHFYGFHTVYNTPSYLISAQYVTSTNTADASGEVSQGAGDGYSFNAEGRMGDEHQYKVFAKYDNWTPDAAKGAKEYTKVTEILGMAWKQNKNVEWVANITINDDDKNHYGSANGGSTSNSTSYMLTTQIDF
ncbi:hypothetical protein MNB_SM-3-528 [hydrothermal vent metagenome]|uniref:Porin n=1 Tax=hydrothermal vent metagenome TaxID=652676 RepID=A0A1W1D2G9_9ZZZZ